MAKPKAPPKRPKPPGSGRKSKFHDGYSASFPEAAYELALLGATLSQVAGVFGIAERTMDEWLRKYPDLNAQFKRGAMAADAEVARSLFRRAKGYSHKDVDIRVIESQIVKTDIEKHYPPDTVACIFWLKNRQTALWRDKVETGVTDKDGKDVPPMPTAEVARRIAFLLASADTDGAQEGVTLQ